MSIPMPNHDSVALSLLDILEGDRAAYYNKQPRVSDAIYDARENRLRSYKSRVSSATRMRIDTFLAGVGAKPTFGRWPKVKHTSPMGSLFKAQNKADFSKWLTGLGQRRDLCWSDKCDGISLSMHYKDGKLIQALTRGDGDAGEDITCNVLLMQGVQKDVPAWFTGKLRAEIVLFKQDRLNHCSKYKNERNGASGIAVSSSGDLCQYLTVLHYRILVEGSGSALNSKYEVFETLKRWGCRVPRYGKKSSLKGIMGLYEDDIAGKRDALPYLIDGLVFEIDDRDEFEQMGRGDNRPKGAVAFKFPSKQTSSLLLDIVWQVGASGRITPVAVIEPVDLDGVTIQRASLANVRRVNELAQSIQRLNLRAGDEVLVSRRNDVIPYIEKMLSTAQVTTHVCAVPTKCPCCDDGLVQKDVYLTCPNAMCPDQVAGRIVRYLEKIGVKGWGTSLIQHLVSDGIVDGPEDLYTLTEDQLDSYVGRKAPKLMEVLNAHLDLPLHIFIGSLSIPLVGRSTAKKIVDDGFDTIEKLLDGGPTDFLAIGPAAANELFFGLNRYKPTIKMLLERGIEVLPPADGPFKGKTICFTGFRDGALGNAVEAAGGTMKGSVGKSLTFLVCKDPSSTSGKVGKAKGYGVTVISVDDLKTMLAPG